MIRIRRPDHQVRVIVRCLNTQQLSEDIVAVANVALLSVRLVAESLDVTRALCGHSWSLGFSLGRNAVRDAREPIKALAPIERAECRPWA
jgi:hypothetical protein